MYNFASEKFIKHIHICNYACLLAECSCMVKLRPFCKSFLLMCVMRIPRRHMKTFFFFFTLFFWVKGQRKMRIKTMCRLIYFFEFSQPPYVIYMEYFFTLSSVQNVITTFEFAQQKHAKATRKKKFNSQTK